MRKGRKFEWSILTNDYVVTHNTILLNAMIRDITTQFPGERVVIIEDTSEIQCSAKNHVQYHTSPDRSMTDLVRMSMRFRPDRILVGEVRGPEALDLLMAWNTGHTGGIASLHANDARSALTRLCTLVSMHPNAPHGTIESLIGEAVDVIVHIARTRTGRIVRETLEVTNWDAALQIYNVKPASA